MFYIDASAIVAAVTAEARSDAVWNWLDRQLPGSVFVSDWTDTEVASALSRKLRTGQLDLEQRAIARSLWRTLRRESLHILGITPEHFAEASAFATQNTLNIRAGDALHLAIAAASGFTLVTLDTTMAKAAPVLGIPVEPLE